MTRIYCRTPATAKRVRVYKIGVGTEFETIAQASDFSVPDSNIVYPVRDPLDAGRAIRPGELFFLVPLRARNTSNTARWIEAELFYEGSIGFAALDRILVPPQETVTIVLQGASLLKQLGNTANGDQLRLRAEVAWVFHVTGHALQRPSDEHIGVFTP
jgi:hypothetical protein